MSDSLQDLRAQLDGVEAEIRRTKDDKLLAIEALDIRIAHWNKHLAWLRGQRAGIVSAIKVASQRARGRL